ncbi:MAG: response regulator, partial [Planctomycetaceae bacterium]|nr:response regulator [Planctomycetaceae bacterium]
MSPAKRILIIDDEPNVRLMFRTALESAGYEVVEAEGGEQGLRRLRQSPADLVLLDLQMPTMGGMEVLRCLRSDENLVPVVIITAYGSVPDAVEAMKLGAIDFLAKPITPDALRQVVAQIIGRHAGDRPGASPPGSGAAADTSPFAESLRRAQRALNRCEFEEAESCLREALALDERSAEVHNLW